MSRTSVLWKQSFRPLRFPLLHSLIMSVLVTTRNVFALSFRFMAYSKITSKCFLCFVQRQHSKYPSHCWVIDSELTIKNNVCNCSDLSQFFILFITGWELNIISIRGHRWAWAINVCHPIGAKYNCKIFQCKPKWNKFQVLVRVFQYILMKLGKYDATAINTLRPSGTYMRQ